jgi:hypothetical protein
MNCDSSINIAARLGDREIVAQFPVRVVSFSSSQRPYRLCGLLSLLPNRVLGGCFPGSKATGAWSQSFDPNLGGEFESS